MIAVAINLCVTPPPPTHTHTPLWLYIRSNKKLQFVIVDSRYVQYTWVGVFPYNVAQMCTVFFFGHLDTLMLDLFLFSLVLQPSAGYGLIVHEVS
jgi:hypothetical protein